MKSTSFFTNVGAVLIAGASLASSRVLSLSSTDTDVVGDTPNCLEGSCDRPGPLEIRGNGSPKIFNPPKPPGLDGALESKLWTDYQDRISSAEFDDLKPTDEVALHTGVRSDNIEAFGTSFEQAFPDRTIRHYFNVIFSDETLRGLLINYTESADPQQDLLPNNLGFYDLAMLARDREKPVHILFPTTAEVQAAAEGKWRKDFLEPYQIYAITSPGTKVTEVLAWDMDTYKEQLKKGKTYKPRHIWKKGWRSIGQMANFTIGAAQ